MAQKKKSNVGLIVLIIILLLACIGMGAFIYMNKDKLTTKENTTTVKNDTVYSNYYETKQEGTEKYFMTLGNMNKSGDSGYYIIRYVSVYDSGAEAPFAEGYYDIKDGKLKIMVGPYTEENNEGVAEEVFEKLSVKLEIDPEQDWREDTTAPSYYKIYQTTYNEDEITIGNKTFYKVK